MPYGICAEIAGNYDRTLAVRCMSGTFLGKIKDVKAEE